MAAEQATLALFTDVCGEQYGFSAEWRRIFDARGLPSAPLFCALPPRHEGQHVDRESGIPWGGWRDKQPTDEM